MLSSPVYAELDPRQHLLPPSAASAPSAFSQPSNLPTRKHATNVQASSEFSHLNPLLSCQQSASVNPLTATLMKSLVTVVNKGLTAKLTPLDATLTKNRGWGPQSPIENPIFVSCILRHSGKWRTDSAPAELTALHGGNRGNWLEFAPEPFLGGSDRTFWPRRYRLSGQYVLGVLPAARNK
jgi:hypothetical protein